MSELHKYIRLVMILGAIVAGLYIIAPLFKMGGDTHIHNHIHTDTNMVKQAYVPPVIIPNNIPIKVNIYLKTDTALRNNLEKEPIIEDVKFKKREVDITTVNDSGQVKTEIHKISKHNKETEINNKGEVKDKEKTELGIALQKVGNRVRNVAAGATVVYLVYKLLRGKL